MNPGTTDGGTMNEERDRWNRDQFRKLVDKHGPEILPRIRSMILERAKSFPDRDRKVKWVFRVGTDGTLSLEVHP